ncbi:MAG TPA: GyrI-like domain-containing protein [Ktedonobacteraceae bacterium]
MREHIHLKIGEFARVGQVSIATLRHYDQCGLLKPNALDPDTGYRYYSLDQLARLNRILALKDLGFPLEQVARLLEEDLSLDQLRVMFTLKQAQAQHMIDIEQARLTRIAARLRQIEQEGIMPAYEVLLKQVDPLLVASVRSIIPMGDDLGQHYATIVAYLDQHHVQNSHPAMLLLHSRYEWYDDRMAIDVETAVPLSTVLPGNEQISTRTLPGGLIASTIHIGDDLSIGQAYAALYRWVKDNGYQIIDPPRLVRLQRSERMNPGQYVTEVQLPVKRQSNREADNVN